MNYPPAKADGVSAPFKIKHHTYDAVDLLFELSYSNYTTPTT